MCHLKNLGIWATNEEIQNEQIETNDLEYESCPNNFENNDGIGSDESSKPKCSPNLRSKIPRSCLKATASYEESDLGMF